MVLLSTFMHLLNMHTSAHTLYLNIHRSAASTDKQLKFYDGYYHELLLEVGREKVEADMVSFIKERTK